MKGRVCGDFDGASFLKRVEDENLHIYNVRIMRDQKLIFQADWAPVERRDIHSVTKTFTSTAIGLAREEGILSLDEYVVDCFADELPAGVPENLRRMQLLHLLTMTMGFREPLLTMEKRPEMRKNVQDWVRYVLSAEVAFAPGECFLYNNAGSYLLSVLLERRTGKTVTEYLTPGLFDRIGITDVRTTEYCPAGHELGASGMLLNVDELLTFGQLYLQEGSWKGEQLIPRNWIREATSLHALRKAGHSMKDVTIQQATTIGAGYGY
ncbi:MAG: beta-lactamase family protein [Lachnospiraceae bacterium]|nr:beta-lactamase family protein [Lachnospiraceae bacterium]